MSGTPNGFLGRGQGATDFGRISWAIGQMLGRMQTATVVQVKACTNAGSLSPVGYVDIAPMVNQIDAQGAPVEHTTIYNVPYCRIQGGINAIIIDPQPGDIGIAVFASRDISKVKATRKRANPGSFRQFSYGDALYIGGVLNGTPSQFVEFSTAGIAITSPTKVTLTAPIVEIDAGTSCTVNTPTFTVNGNSVLNGTISQTGGGAAHFTGSMTVDGDVTAQGTSVHNHVHSGVQSGGSNTGAPV